MASFWYQAGMGQAFGGAIDWVNDDIRIIWAMSNTTADTENSSRFVSDFSTLDEFDGSGYPSTFATRLALDNQTLTVDDPNRQVELDADNETVSTVGAGTRNVVGVVVYQHNTSDADSELLGYLDLSAATGNGEEFNGNGGDITLAWDAEGLLKILCSGV